MYFSRVRDQDDEVLGYIPSSPRSALPPEQRAKFEELPARFRFKDAKLIYGKGDQAASDFLKKCIGLGLLNKVGHTYFKAEATE